MGLKTAQYNYREKRLAEINAKGSRVGFCTTNKQTSNGIHVDFEDRLSDNAYFPVPQLTESNGVPAISV
jgi:hypothetical protein